MSITFRFCQRCEKYSAISLGPNCRLHSSAAEVAAADEFDALPFAEQMLHIMTMPIND